MRCEELQNSISLSGDNLLDPVEEEVLIEHLSSCPLCRQERDDVRSLTRELRMLPRPVMPQTAVNYLRSKALQLLGANVPGFWLAEDRRPWTKAWLMPSGVGVFASVLGALSFLWLLSVSPGSNARKPDLMFPDNTIARVDPKQRQYAEPRQDVSYESPSINPQGALVALTNSFVRGEMKDDEVVVVAEIFGNGLARIDEVVEPSRNRRAVGELEKALDSDPAFAPFVPANLDQRPESVRVVLKIRNVDVNTRIRRR